MFSLFKEVIIKTDLDFHIQIFDSLMKWDMDSLLEKAPINSYIICLWSEGIPYLFT